MQQQSLYGLGVVYLCGQVFRSTTRRGFQVRKPELLLLPLGRSVLRAPDLGRKNKKNLLINAPPACQTEERSDESREGLTITPYYHGTMPKLRADVTCGLL